MLSIGVPAYNEEKNLLGTIERIDAARKKSGIKKIEVIIVNDGSTGRTGDVISEIEKKYKYVRSITHVKNMGIATGMKTAIKEAKYESFLMVAGDGDVSLVTLVEFFKNCGKADFVGSFIMNVEERYKYRIIISAIYSLLYVIFFNVTIKYVNGMAIYPTRLLKNLEIKSTGYLFNAEIAVKLLLQGITFYEILSYINPAPRKSSALKLKNIFNTVWGLLRLIWDVRVANRKLYSKLPVRIVDQ